MGGLKIWTIGHSTRPVEQLVSLLKGAAIRLLVDVRAHPGSRRHPQFNQEPLEQALAAHDIAYRWEGDALGGYRKPRPGSLNAALRNESFRGYADHMGSAEFTAASGRIIESARGARLALMCAEQHPSQMPSPADLGLAVGARRRSRAPDRQEPHRAARLDEGSGDCERRGHLSRLRAAGA